MTPKLTAPLKGGIEFRDGAVNATVTVLSWRAADPAVVMVWLQKGRERAGWAFHRDQLGPADGERHGEPGFTAVAREGNTLRLTLPMRDGSVDLLVRAGEVAEFLDATWDACPPCAERARVGVALREFLAGIGASS